MYAIGPSSEHDYVTIPSVSMRPTLELNCEIITITIIITTIMISMSIITHSFCYFLNPTP
jgi:hypothetical protein